MSAENTTNAAPWLLEAVDSTHTCRICYEEFNEKNKVPRILWCGHTFCMQCLVSWMRVNHATFPTCPVCRKVTKQVITSLPINFQLMQLLQKLALTGENAEADDISSTVATTGNETDNAPARRPTDFRNVDRSSLSLLEKIYVFQEQMRELKDDLSNEIYESITRNDNNFHLHQCTAHMEEIETHIDFLINVCGNDAFNEIISDSELDDEDEIDDFDNSDFSDTSFNIERRIRDRDIAVGITNMLSGFNIQELASPFWIESDDISSQYTLDIFVPEVNAQGSNVMRCVVCECMVPLGGEDAHISGRRHQLNNERRLRNEPIITADEWREQNHMRYGSRHRNNNLNRQF
ncbi:unnamed protein product [Caenorhabditis bovis]|uniref:RING-type domain-containing protein n=1 Tax=Caenorhabditis bovis TaxID=2654633 RepID=A0A8S1ETV7_9PELO|nr:unnamed protein product [Caenorhabditis bovis]